MKTEKEIAEIQELKRAIKQRRLIRDIFCYGSIALFSILTIINIYYLWTHTIW